MLCKALIFTTLAALFTAAIPALAADCDICKTNYIDAAIAKKRFDTTDALLKKNKAAVAKLGSDDTSKKVKIASNILQLTTRLETEKNTKIAADQTLFDNKCNLCPKPRQEDIDKAERLKK